MLVLLLQENTNMDQLFTFYLTLAILGVGFAILIVFGKTEEKILPKEDVLDKNFIKDYRKIYA